jgi:outer membrane protein OmpA-like peptidoglycan-associated protein
MMMHARLIAKLSIFLIATTVMLSSCTFSKSGDSASVPDKEMSYRGLGALSGAGKGALIGFQVSGSTGPGALVGAGLGAVGGTLQGIAHDENDRKMQQIKEELQFEQRRMFAQSIIAAHLDQKIKFHPQRDIYPADVFFSDDSTVLCNSGQSIINEIASLEKNHFPWSRYAIVSYIVSPTRKTSFGERTSSYAKHLSEKRALELANQFIRAGINPKRIEVFGKIVNEPIIELPDEDPMRYAQAIEFVPIDRQFGRTFKKIKKEKK